MNVLAGKVTVKKFLPPFRKRTYFTREEFAPKTRLFRTDSVCINAASTLQKHAYSNILKISPPKNENFEIKKF